MMKILVVDDEADVQPLFQQRFRKEIKNGEVTFTFAQSGEEALDFFYENPAEIILILSDINMPGMSGLELLDQVRQKFQNAPPLIMMITAYGDDDNRNYALSHGANDFLTKPLDFNLLKEKLKTLT